MMCQLHTFESFDDNITVLNLGSNPVTVQVLADVEGRPGTSERIEYDLTWPSAHDNGSPNKFG